MLPFLKNAEGHLKFKYKNITADAGYESEKTIYKFENCSGCSYKKEFMTFPTFQPLAD
jgi:hypothetical protein